MENILKENAKVLNKYLALQLRERYIKKFINTESEWYKEYILKDLKLGKSYYNGYLRDCLRKSDIFHISELVGYLEGEEEVYVFWDLHQDTHQLDKGKYWLFEKESILEIKYKILLKSLDFLPEDLYVFDKSFQWSIIFTHEYRNNERILLISS